MLFSKRLELAQRFELWRRKQTRNGCGPSNEALSVVTWLDIIGMLKSPPTAENKEEKFTSTNSAMVPCPTCGAACSIGGDDEEETHYYIPVVSFRAQGQ